VFQDLLKERGVDARLYRVEDNDLHIWANQSDTANDFYEEIQALPIASSETLLKSDMVILGCPTTFGNISAEMKTFMDSTYSLAQERALEGTLFACFTSCSYSIAEGAFTIDSLVHYAQMMSMIHIPLGLRGADQPVSGIVHLAGKGNTIRPSQQLGDVLASYADTLAEYLVEEE